MTRQQFIEAFETQQQRKQKLLAIVLDSNEIFERRLKAFFLFDIMQKRVINMAQIYKDKSLPACFEKPVMGGCKYRPK